jgi:hypothetical protein
MSWHGTVHYRMAVPRVVAPESPPRRSRSFVGMPYGRRWPNPPPPLSPSPREDAPSGDDDAAPATPERRPALPQTPPQTGVARRELRRAHDPRNPPYVTPMRAIEDEDFVSPAQPIESDPETPPPPPPAPSTSARAGQDDYGIPVAPPVNNVGQDIDRGAPVPPLAESTFPWSPMTNFSLDSQASLPSSASAAAAYNQPALYNAHRPVLRTPHVAQIEATRAFDAWRHVDSGAQEARSVRRRARDEDDERQRARRRLMRRREQLESGATLPGDDMYRVAYPTTERRHRHDREYVNRTRSNMPPPPPHQTAPAPGPGDQGALVEAKDRLVLAIEVMVVAADTRARREQAHYIFEDALEWMRLRAMAGDINVGDSPASSSSSSSDV